ncbi:AAA family ATPase [Arundinibacter roseus]|uniref:AAA family ATPase n=2 Tax=Arundinibacter roseus TaxID=2070510 RepID=A0A4R4KLL1_9BACT|nr:AAA family ATPase [Arundinibacter roseus]
MKKFTEQELQEYLLQQFPKENERCEWKEFKNLKHSIASQAGEDVISYVSAISNMKGGHLVLGVKDTTLEIVGIQDFHTYNPENIKIRLINDCPNLVSEGLLVEEFQTLESSKWIWVIHIPKHPFRQPVYAHKKAWQRLGDSLVELTQARKEAILYEVKPTDDWSAVILPEATIEDLDVQALKKARFEFQKRNPKYAPELDQWDDVKFLDKARLTIKGKITRACMMLLGKEEEEHFLNSTVKIRWTLRTLDNQDKDFEVFSIPLILAVDEVFTKIRNLKYRYLRPGTLFPDEVLRYAPFTIRELLNNAIAHQDYTKGARINVVEFEDDHLVFSNYGAFLPKSVEEVVLSDSPEEVYRNPYLVEAMKNLDMIETQGGGIRKIFNFQRKRFFPMPDYDLSDGKVKVTILGKVLDEEFANILVQNPDLSLEEIIAMDKVQKKMPLTNEEYNYLKKKQFISGRKPNIYLSEKVIAPINNENLRQEYIRNRGFDDQYCKDLILEYLAKWGKANRRQIENLIWDKLSDVLSEDRKKNKVGNLLSALRIQGKIKSVGFGTWEPVKPE